MEGDRISYHDSVRRVYERIKKDGMDNIWDRYEAQGLGSPDKRCPFCQAGVRCDLCSNGPCRADAAKDKKGVCGIKADGMAMRMMLLRNVMGASTYQYHTEQTIKTIRATARGETPYQIREKEKLKTFAKRLGISTAGPVKQIALRLCDFVQADFNQHSDSRIVMALAPKERQAAWIKLGIFPSGQSLAGGAQAVLVIRPVDWRKGGFHPIPGSLGSREQADCPPGGRPAAGVWLYPDAQPPVR